MCLSRLKASKASPRLPKASQGFQGFARLQGFQGSRLRGHTFDFQQGFGVTPLIFSAQRDLSGKLAEKSRGQ
jgi:hypothetical protein